MNTMNYLFAAYAAIWIILALYLYSISTRERRLREDVDRLKQQLNK
jgi:CcmD family protein